MSDTNDMMDMTDNDKFAEIAQAYAELSTQDNASSMAMRSIAYSLASIAGDLHAIATMHARCKHCQQSTEVHNG